MSLPTSRNTTYAALSQVKSADLNDIQDKIIDNYGILNDTAVALGGASAADLPTQIVATAETTFALSVFRLVSGTAPTVGTDEGSVDFGGVNGTIRVPIQIWAVGTTIEQLSAVFLNDGGTLTVRLKAGATTLFTVAQVGAGAASDTDDNGGTPHVVGPTEPHYLEIVGSSLTGSQNLVQSIKVIAN